MNEGQFISISSPGLAVQTFVLARVLECPPVCDNPLCAHRQAQSMSGEQWRYLHSNSQLTLVAGFADMSSQRSR